ncbi:glycoside hydrolase family 3 protein [Candidatus Soleaferrea massiliensis]|uniref:glycoside hydrolase family 3 protein n=1 Tax=Candidatus Soleaferrea massiliensis TaxID=1470354 RepID=UPI001FA7E869|nr:glycoside hydrolase family 3 N-terminal domain-containing protein [Candidatus Soleaferrea massiliensis]
MKQNTKKGLALALAVTFVASSMGLSAIADDTPKYTIKDSGKGYMLVENQGGKTLGYSPDSGVQILEQDGYAFKDLNQNGELDVYEDWRLDTKTRATDLAAQLVKDGRSGIETIAGLMLYSVHQTIPGGSMYGGDTYGGEKNGEGVYTGGLPYADSGANAWDLSDMQKTFLDRDNLRHVLITSVESPEVAAKWSNNVQAFVEGLGYGIPANNSSDPRHGASGANDVEYVAGQGGKISLWPSSIGMAATFDPELVEKFGDIASKEYRALGIATALSPQIDLATEPRWNRFNGTFGENTKLATDMARAYVDGFQTTEGSDTGWGGKSVNAMIKHWPSGGPEEGGRDGHYGYGKFTVYPGENFDEHLKTFTEGAFKLNGGTGMASAVMPYYTISYNQDTKYGENVGNSYSKYIIGDLLRGEYNYDGVVCTDWLVTADATQGDIFFEGKCWGTENLTVSERHYKILMAGVDQFGGNNDKAPVMDAYDMMVEEMGQTDADFRFQESARRLLTNIFNAGLFENPYLDPDESEKEVGNSDYMTEGYDAQLKSVVMIKNSDGAIVEQSKDKKKTAYVVGMEDKLVSKYYDVTEDPDKADFAIVAMNAPQGGQGYDSADLAKGGNGYFPVTLQYSSYTADTAREKSIASYPLLSFDKEENRSYKGKTVEIQENLDELKKLQDAKEAMGGKPVITYVKATNPMVFSEVEPLSDAILVGYDIQDQAALDIISGKTEPSGLLPMQQPKDMETVEKQYEDVGQDMDCYKDENGNVYDFAFGLNWSGQIKDERTLKYAGFGPDKDTSSTSSGNASGSTSSKKNPGTGSPLNSSAAAGLGMFLLVSAGGAVLFATKRKADR